MARLEVKVVPGASREGVSGWLGDRLKIHVRQPPEKGRATAAVARVLAAALGVDAAAVTLVSGGSSPLKTFQIDGLDEPTIRERIAAEAPSE
jgi:uncharacterized protein YggU (UPF0235/DUF167 family)